MHDFAFKDLGDWLMSDSSVPVSRYALHRQQQRTMNKEVTGYALGNNGTHRPQTEYLFNMHLYDDTFVWTGASLLVQLNVTINPILALSGLFRLLLTYSIPHSIIIPMWLRRYLFSISACPFKNIVMWNDRNLGFPFVWELVLLSKESSRLLLSSPRRRCYFLNYSANQELLLAWS